jgi:hypothetical protein
MQLSTTPQSENIGPILFVPIKLPFDSFERDLKTPLLTHKKTYMGESTLRSPFLGKNKEFNKKFKIKFLTFWLVSGGS